MNMCVNCELMSDEFVLIWCYNDVVYKTISIITIFIVKLV
jgi:hypothetical protein